MVETKAPKTSGSPGNGSMQLNVAAVEPALSSDTALAQVFDSLSVHTLRDQQLQTFDTLGLSALDVASMASPWEMFSQALRTQFQGDANWPGLQLLSLPIDADWNDPQYGHYRAWKVLADSLPSFGPNYKPTQMSIAESYFLFITNIDIPLPDEDDRKKAEKARSAYQAAVAKLSKAYSNVAPDWVKFDQTQQSVPPPRRLTFDAWYAAIEGPIIGSVQDEVNLAAQEYSSWLVKAYRGYAFVADLVPNFSNPAFQMMALAPDGTQLSYHTYNIDPDLGHWIEDSKQLVAQGAPPKLTFALDKSSQQYHSEDLHVSGGLSWSVGFFSFGANGNYGRSSVDSSSDAFKLRASFRNVGVFTITPSQWFNGTAVKVFKNGPWIKDGPVANGTAELWGPSGVFGLMPIQVLVAYRPRIEVTMSQSEFHQVQTSFSASGGFSIGPFGFGAAYSRNTNDVRFDASSNTIVAEDTSDTPQILAVLSSVLPDFT